MPDRHDVATNELLLALARRDSKSTLSPTHAAILMDPARREALLRLAARHFLHGVLLSRLSTLDTIDADHEAIRDRSRATLRPLTTNALLWDLERDRLLTLLAAKNIQPLLLKGAALRCTVYERPVLRPLGDIDLLVHPDRFDETLSVVRDMGYDAPFSESDLRDLEAHHFHLRVNRDPFVVEIHWALAQDSQPFELDAASFFRRAQPIELPSLASKGAFEAWVPSAEDMVLHLVAQNLHHGTRLGRLVDVDRVATLGNGLDWERLDGRAVKAGLTVALAVDLRLCQKLLGTQMPEDFLSGLGLTSARLRNLAIMRPTRWAFSTMRTKDVVRDLRRRWCISDDFRRKRRANEHRLQWLWPDRPMSMGPPPAIEQAKRLGKLIAYQAWFYIRAAASFAGSKGRRDLRFWQGPSSDLVA